MSAELHVYHSHIFMHWVGLYSAWLQQTWSQMIPKVECGPACEDFIVLSSAPKRDVAASELYTNKEQFAERILLLLALQQQYIIRVIKLLFAS